MRLLRCLKKLKDTSIVDEMATKATAAHTGSGLRSALAALLAVCIDVHPGAIKSEKSEFAVLALLFGAGRSLKFLAILIFSCGVLIQFKCTTSGDLLRSCTSAAMPCIFRHCASLRKSYYRVEENEHSSRERTVSMHEPCAHVPALHFGAHQMFNTHTSVRKSCDAWLYAQSSVGKRSTVQEANAERLVRVLQTLMHNLVKQLLVYGRLTLLNSFMELSIPLIKK